MMVTAVRCVLMAGICAGLTTIAAAAESYSLAEDYTNPRQFSVELKMTVTGKMQASGGTNKKSAIGMNLDVEATLNYDERRLPPAGRDALALRTARTYRDAHANIKVNGQTTLPRLRTAHRVIVAEGQSSGLRYYSLERPLYFTELELLQAPGDSLAALALLPGREIAVGDTWKADNWVAQFVTSLEAAEKGEIECTAKSLENDLLQVHYTGEVKGAIYGAYTTVTVEGDYWFNVKEGYLQKLELKQTEKRTIGVVSQGLDVEARVTMQRKPVPVAPALADEAIAEIPLDSNPASLLVAFDSNAWNVRLHHSRLWHLYKHERDAAAFRLVDRGSFIAQCKIAPLRNAKPGEHMDEDRFLKDIQTTLGESFQGVKSLERIKGEALEDDKYVYRVESYGAINDLEVVWIHYLIAAPDGRQMALIFTVGKEVVEKFGNHDLELAARLEFLQPRSPEQAADAPSEGRKK